MTEKNIAKEIRDIALKNKGFDLTKIDKGVQFEVAGVTFTQKFLSIHESLQNLKDVREKFKTDIPETPEGIDATIEYTYRSLSSWSLEHEFNLDNFKAFASVDGIVGVIYEQISNLEAFKAAKEDEVEKK